MRQEVYTKFAEALQRKQAEQAAALRHQEVVAKFAEALDRQMAQKQAEEVYFEGFRKAAELAGVDPDALVKQALGLGSIASAGRAAMGGAKRVGQLLAGGNAKVTKPLDSLTAAASKSMAASRQTAEYAAQPFLTRMKSYLRGAQMRVNTPIAAAKGKVLMGTQEATDAMTAAGKERVKSWLARAGAGAAATGAAGAGIAAATGDDQE